MGGAFAAAQQQQQYKGGAGSLAAMDPIGSRLHQGGGMGGPPSLAPLNKHAGAAGRGGDSVVGGYGGAGVIQGSYARNAR
jgi:hypothetical protein